MSIFLENRPTAEVLMTSMRALGYSFESAVADIIDNSVSASAHKVLIKFPVDPSESYLAICDDGYGMTQDELFKAMRYGCEQVNSERSNTDLGRFGLGLKAASLSQCRRLSVLSKKNGIISAFAWDLDVIEEKKDWMIMQYSPEQLSSIKCVSYLNDMESGTVVLWENFDLLEKSSCNVYAALIKHQESVADYLSLIFHRFLNRTGRNRLEIKVNNYSLCGLDPFLENHNKTNVRKEVKIPVKDSQGIERMISVQPFVLPFQKDLTAEDKRLSGGMENYRSKQGFYIYRNERLIVWGSWFGRHRDELTKYARIRVDIPNTLDDIWGIDIKKQSAKIPEFIKRRLTRAVDDAMDASTKAQKHRGRVEKVDDRIDYIWDRVRERGEQFSYRINRNSKVFDLIKSKAGDEIWSLIDMVLEEIENAVPYQQIYIDKSQNRISEDVSDERIAEVEAKARALISLAQKMGSKSRTQIIDALFNSEPFTNFPALKEKLAGEYHED